MYVFFCFERGVIASCFEVIVQSFSDWMLVSNTLTLVSCMKYSSLRVDNFNFACSQLFVNVLLDFAVLNWPVGYLNLVQWHMLNRLLSKSISVIDTADQRWDKWFNSIHTQVASCCQSCSNIHGHVYRNMLGNTLLIAAQLTRLPCLALLAAV